MRRTLHDLATLAARIGVGGLFFANGWHKLEVGLTATGTQFAAQGAPAPGAWAAVTMLTELIGGALLVAGLFTPMLGLVLFAETLAVFFVARPLNPIDTNLIVALGAASVLLAVTGAGRVSVDHMVVIRRREAEAADEFAAENEADDVIAALRDPDAVRELGARRDAVPPDSGSPDSGSPDPSLPVMDRPVADSRGSGETDAGSPDPGAREEAGPGDDTAPHHLPRTVADELPGDTLVAGKKTASAARSGRGRSARKPADPAE
ncbi:DoxX family protein [Nonomuraea africana]|uniref:Oxidoreductase n=1 Tax=Nonomuraea africana TaxID=46171 RepID=A0ABR9K7N9_9ACTN|nr:DoxX family protein [Nonomuraea africana]MBE1558017.1 putative oxidoreductase [Nonomuraea africana]